MAGQYIFGRMDPKHTFAVQDKLIKSGQSKVIDNVSQGYAPTQEGTGVLYTWKNTPLAYVNIPTLNRMIFSRALWEGLRNNEHLKFMLEGRSHWMGDCHKDKDEITFSEIAGRVSDFWIDGDLVMGDIDLMDTPNGLIIYACAKTGRVANSSRGFGELRDTHNGLKEVVPDQYMHVSWDFVTFPAVNRCLMTMADDITSTTEVDNLSDYLKGLIAEAYERNPKDKALQKLMSNAKVSTGKKFDYAVRNAVSEAVIMRELKTNVIKSNGSFLKSGTDPDTGKYFSSVEGAVLAGELSDIFGIKFSVGDDIIKLHHLGLDANREALSGFGKLLEVEQKWETDPQGPAKRTQKIYKLQDIYDMAKKELVSQLKLGYNKDYDRVYRAMGLLLTGKYGVDYLYRNILPDGVSVGKK